MRVEPVRRAHVVGGHSYSSRQNVNRWWFNNMTTPSSRQPRRRCTLDVIILFVTLALLSSLNCIPTVSAGVDTERKQAVVDALGEVQIEEPFEDIDGGATTSSIFIPRRMQVTLLKTR